MKIKNIGVSEYIEEFDGSVEGCVMVKDLGEGFGVYENENGKFVIDSYGKEGEFIWRLFEEEM